MVPNVLYKRLYLVMLSVMQLIYLKSWKPYIVHLVMCYINFSVIRLISSVYTVRVMPKSSRALKYIRKVFRLQWACPTIIHALTHLRRSTMNIHGGFKYRSHRRRDQRANNSCTAGIVYLIQKESFKNVQKPNEILSDPRSLP